MNSLTLTSAFAPTRATNSSQMVDPYASEAQTTALLRTGAQYRRDRMDAQDMITTEEAANLAGTTRVTINAWIKSGRCVGVAHLRRGFKLPKWQFEPAMWAAIAPLSAQLGTADGWRVLGFLETSLQALGGLTPRAALEQGVALDRVLALANAEAH
ncbi:MAG: hypothetical protein Q7K57_17595 [Burkholderiaceae bacterium]|nr:hypothetical protein [Burkholderiaceae bacterium]